MGIYFVLLRDSAVVHSWWGAQHALLLQAHAVARNQLEAKRVKPDGLNFIS